MYQRQLWTFTCILLSVLNIKKGDSSSSSAVLNTNLAGNENCPVGWQSNISSYYCYYFSLYPTTWADANRDCYTKHQSTLAYFEDILELDRVVDFLVTLWPSTTHFWVGFHKEMSNSSETHQYWNPIAFNGRFEDRRIGESIPNGSVITKPILKRSVKSGLPRSRWIELLRNISRANIITNNCAAVRSTVLKEFETRLQNFSCYSQAPYICMKSKLGNETERVEWYCGVGGCCYATLKEKFSFWNAQEECRLVNSRAHLPLFDNSTQWESFLNYRNHKNLTSQKRTAWLDYFTVATDGNWLSYDGYSPTFQKWTSKGSFKHNTQYCAVTGWDMSDEWTNHECTEQRQTVCQICGVNRATQNLFKRYEEKSVSTPSTTTTVMTCLIVLLCFTLVIIGCLLLRRGNQKFKHFTNERFSKVTSIVCPSRSRMTGPNYETLNFAAIAEPDFI